MGRVFTIIASSILLAVLTSCEPQRIDNIPYAFVEIDINLNNTDYFALQRDGGFVYELGGVKGIIIYRENSGLYRAFEQNSPVNPSAACAIVQVDDSQLFMIDHCSQATFDFDGNPSNGVSPFPLRQYTTILDQNWLYIRSEI